MKTTGLQKKLRSTAGETIAEVLISLLIASVALMMLATMISSTVNLVMTSKDTIKKYYDDNTPLEMQSVEDGETVGTETVTLQAIEGVTYPLKQEISIIIFENDTFRSADRTVYAYSTDSP